VLFVLLSFQRVASHSCGPYETCYITLKLSVGAISIWGFISLFEREILGWSNVKTGLNFSRFVIDLCFFSVYSLVDSSVGDHQRQGPGGHQDQRGLGPRVVESCSRKQVRILLILMFLFRYFFLVGFLKTGFH